MDSLYDRTTEDSLVALAAAGFLIDLSVNGFGDQARFRVKITRGSAYLGGTGLEISAEGEGADGAAKLRGAVATAETFLYTVAPQQRRIVADQLDLPPPSAPLESHEDPAALPQAAE